MLTKRENLLIAARGGRPEWVPSFTADINLYCPSIWNVDSSTMLDWTGARWINDAAGQTADTAHPPLASIIEWRDKVCFPDLATIDFEKEIAEFFADEHYDATKALYVLADGGPSIFTRPIHLLGWEVGLTSHYEEPEELMAFIDALTDFQLELTELLCTYLTPDIISTGDDFAFSAGPFIPKTLWDEFYRDNLRRIIDHIHSKGALAQFHNCGNNGYLLDESLAIGVDIMELPVPNDSLKAAKARYGSRFVLCGGWDRLSAASIDPFATEEVVRASVREALDTYGKDGALIFWDGGLIVTDDRSAQKMAWLTDELERYGRTFYQ